MSNIQSARDFVLEQARINIERVSSDKSYENLAACEQAAGDIHRLTGSEVAIAVFPPREKIQQDN
jgi:hypothetical protein